MHTTALLLTAAWLLPLAGFAIEIFGGYWSHHAPGGRFQSRLAAYLAVGCIGGGFLLSLGALAVGLPDSGNDEAHAAAQFAVADDGTPADHKDAADTSHEKPAGHEDGDHHDKDGHGHTEATSHGGHGHSHQPPRYISGQIYELARFGNIRFAIDYYIDQLTLVMFAMVTLIATCIHVFAIGYMDDERTDDHADHEVHMSDGSHLHRPGRFYRFFAYLSLFCFSMLGIVLAGNVFMVFVFWELVGISSFLLIGFYVERHSASTAANKAFIVNRVGDFGFIIGLMILVTSFGTFGFATYNDGGSGEQPGLFEMARDDHGVVHVETGTDGSKTVAFATANGSHTSIPYWLMVVAGLGVFGGCVGKSAQFPLQTWLPDAMEGPTPVSALVHSATMVAAGVYLAARFFPVFLPEVLLTIAYVGAITLFVAATIAVVATDIKRVLAYSTISQLGYMMLAIGLGGWVAGVFHLVTHAFFKSLMFLASGSVIAGCHHEQEMPKMGGLRHKMPITAYTMLVGVIAICGLAIPFHWILPSIGHYYPKFSGYHSKDAILATAWTYLNLNPIHALLFLLPLVTAGITAFYMFRLWFYTFAGKPRDQHLHDHCHESPKVMTAPLLVLSFFAIFCAWGGEHGPLFESINLPGKHVENIAGSGIELATHHAVTPEFHTQAGVMALLVATLGTLMAYLMYCRQSPDPSLIKRQFAATHEFLVEKWRFDDLYDAMFVRPVHVVASWFAGFDRGVLDGVLHWFARTGVVVSDWDRKFDESVVDGMVNWIARRTQDVGRSLQGVQTGRLRQYVMFIALGVVTLFVLIFALFPRP